MYDIRVKFIRGEEVKFISHLDLMKTFGRAVRRSRLPISYSQGFNPHPQMVFGLPLAVGVTSEAEYADIELVSDMEPDDFIRALNRQLPQGLLLLEGKRRQSKANIMASVVMGDYAVLARCEEDGAPEQLKEKLERFLALPEITVVKESKGGSRQVDIRPMILRLEAVLPDTWGKREDKASLWAVRRVRDLQDPGKNSGEGLCLLSARLSAGSSANLKPELLVAALNETLHTGLEVLGVHRTELFVRSKSGAVVKPLDDVALSG